MLSALVLLRLKLLFKDKITYVWTILLPVIMTIFNKENITEDTIIFYIIYMIIYSLFYGTAFKPMQEIKNGTAEHIFSYYRAKKYEYFLSLLFVQIIYILISSYIYMIFCYIFIGDYFLKYMLYIPIITMLSIPIGFLFFNLVLINVSNINTFYTIGNIILFIMLMLLNVETPINYINPMVWFYLSFVNLINFNLNFLIVYALFSLLIIVLSMYSILRFKYSRIKL